MTRVTLAGQTFLLWSPSGPAVKRDWICCQLLLFAPIGPFGELVGIVKNFSVKVSPMHWKDKVWIEKRWRGRSTGYASHPLFYQSVRLALRQKVLVDYYYSMTWWQNLWCTLILFNPIIKLESWVISLTHIVGVRFKIHLSVWKSTPTTTTVISVVWKLPLLLFWIMQLVAAKPGQLMYCDVGDLLSAAVFGSLHPAWRTPGHC